MNDSQEQRHTHQEAVEDDQYVLDEDLQEVLDQFRTEQNLAMGIIGGLGGAILGALIWACITVITNYQIGYMAVGVGYLSGMGMRMLGKGIDPIFGYLGAILALLGCVMGDSFCLIHYTSLESELTYMHLLMDIDYGHLSSVLWETADHMTLLFYGIAIYQGYQLSFRQIDIEPTLTSSE